VETLLRLKSVSDATGLRRAAIYRAVKAGTFPPPVHIAPRCVAWPSSEIEAINQARIEAQPDSKIRVLVADLVKARIRSVA
jgi:prophage regulatory protein